MIEIKISVHKREEKTMGKQHWKPGNMLNPVPAVMVSVTDKEGKSNIITVAWAGTVCTNPPMVSISVRPSRYSYQILEETGEFVINLTNESLVKACDYCGVVSGRDVNKFAKTGLTPIPMEHVHAMGIDESPVASDFVRCLWKRRIRCLAEQEKRLTLLWLQLR